MTYPETGFQCSKCGIRFAIVPAFQATYEVTWCATPGCNVRFSHAGDERGIVRCEVIRADLESTSGRISKLDAVLSHG